MLPTVDESHGYDFQDPENKDKWKGLFANALKKVLEQVHPALCAEDGALAYVELLCLRLLGMLCAIPSPLTMQDVEDRVAKSFPTPIDKWALSDARDTVDRTKKKKSILPTDRVHQLLQKEVLLYKIDISVSVFIVAILEYIAADVLKLAGNYVKKISQKSGDFKITYQDIRTAMCADKVLMDMFYQDDEFQKCAVGEGGGGRLPCAPRRGSLTYAELVKDLLSDERQFLRELHLIIRVFKEEIEKIVEKNARVSRNFSRHVVRLIFANIVDIYELTITLLGNLEDAMEMSQDSPTPYIGSCFEELAEVEEFRAYLRYANMVTTPESRDALQSIVDDPEISEQLATAGHGFRLAVKYYLPRLLLAPIAHIFLYHNYVLALLQIAPTQEDRESFKQVECNLHPIKKSMIKALAGNGPKIDSALRMATRARRQLAIEKTNELSRLIDNWDNRDTGQCCNEFIREDTLAKVGPGKRVAERRAYLFDGLLILCKPVSSLVTVPGSVAALGVVTAAPGAQQLKLKEKLFLRKLDVIDRSDTDDMKHCVELAPRVGSSVILSCGSAAEKKNWMADLVMLNTKSMLDRTLDSILLDLENTQNPLKMPPPELYRFTTPDLPQYIVFEERQNSGVPLIKGATLLKLVERLTYHKHADLTFVRTFLTTYRSFCKPNELLDLLVERFHIPDPSLVYGTPEKNDGSEVTESEKLNKNTAREDCKRYRKEFSQPIRFRVINVLRHWVDQHFYDFERDPELLDKLKEFLESVDGKPMKKWVHSVLKTIIRKTAPPDPPEGAGVGAPPAHVFDRAPPAVFPHPHDPERYNWNPLALHPVELARQLTLLDFDLYRTVKPSELVGAVFQGKGKEMTSPNSLRISKHSTNFTFWIEKYIMEAENLDERRMVLGFFLRVMAALRDLNNFNGVIAVLSAMESASVHRLKFTFQMITARLERALAECRELNSDHYRRYQEHLRSINPPCVPFLGIYLTNIVKIEEGNGDFLPDSELINFSKRRKVAEITGEIQQYQNQPYCLTVEPKTRAFLENLDPFPGMTETEINDYLYFKSLEIEPRPPRGEDTTRHQLPKFPRKWPDLTQKASSRKHGSHHHSPQVPPDADDNISQLSPTSGWDVASVSSFGSQQSLQSVQSHSVAHSDELSMQTIDEEGKEPQLRAKSGRWNSELGSPRLVNSTSTGVFERGFRIFDKDTSRLASTMSLNRHSVISPRDLSPACPPPPLSPRPPISTATSPAAPPRLPPHTSDAPILPCEAKHQKIVSDILASSGRDAEKVAMAKSPALSPRNAIIDASLFYCTNGDASLLGKKSPSRVAGDFSELRTGRPPALSPRNCNGRTSQVEVDRSTKPSYHHSRSASDASVLTLPQTNEEIPPLIMPRTRTPSVTLHDGAPGPLPNLYGNSRDCYGEEWKPERPGKWETPTSKDTILPERHKFDASVHERQKSDSSILERQKYDTSVPERPPALSPRHKPNRNEDTPTEAGFASFRAPGVSPHLPPLSPHVNVPNSVQNYERHHGIGAAFSFPSTRTTVSQATPTSPTASVQPLLGAPHTPPPLPPRRQRDSSTATTPVSQGGNDVGSCSWESAPLVPPRSSPPPPSCPPSPPPPPLPPRPPVPPPGRQLRPPAHSTILQRRHATHRAHHDTHNTHHHIDMSDDNNVLLSRSPEKAPSPVPKLPPKPAPALPNAVPKHKH